MAQGKIKIKTTLPAKIKTASVHRGTSNRPKTKGKSCAYQITIYKYK